MCADCVATLENGPEVDVVMDWLSTLDCLHCPVCSISPSASARECCILGEREQGFLSVYLARGTLVDSEVSPLGPVA